MSRFAIFASLLLILAGCADPVPGAPVTSPVSTNTAGRIHITVDPCTIVPASVIERQQLNKGTPRSDSQTNGDIENVFCKYRSQNEYYLTVSASNYTLEMLKKTANHWDQSEFELNGRRVLSAYTSPQPEKHACSMDVAASTGVYGVVLGTIHDDFSPYPDCLTAARANLEAFLPYFPS
ncbi:MULTISPECIES: DUF3558 family protein [Mycobacteroides]|uniref:DUF3558 family protein n=1 Tax=Mycobacteroides TaxID=670516 RepID=UPI000991A7B4|nr:MULTISPECIES: DUF3558 family protein [Mycobacteroides]